MRGDKWRYWGVWSLDAFLIALGLRKPPEQRKRF